MRKTVLEQAKEFILDNTKKNNFIFNSSEIKTTIKNFLIENNYLYSPIKNIFLLKKSDEKSSEKIEKYKFKILEKLIGQPQGISTTKKDGTNILSGEFLINYYLGKPEISRVFRIITKSKNFESFLGEEENIKIIFKPSLVPRITKIVKIDNSNLEIETKLSFIINNYYLFFKDKDFQKIILDTDFNLSEIENLIRKKFKFSAISKLAIFYKNNKQIGKYNNVMQAIKNSGKKIDRRGTKVITKKEIDKKIKKVNLNDLF